MPLSSSKTCYTCILLGTNPCYKGVPAGQCQALINKAPPLNRDHNRDLKALERRGFMNLVYTIQFNPGAINFSEGSNFGTSPVKLAAARISSAPIPMPAMGRKTPS